MEATKMADIKITLSTDPLTRSSTIQEEAAWLNEAGALFYPLHVKPTQASKGCWVYFIRDGKVVGGARARRFVEWRTKNKEVSYTGVRLGKPGWRVAISPPMQLAKRPFAHEGFQGFRYVKVDEQARFESAFKADREQKEKKREHLAVARV
jgi:hypothetical protein